jgi:sarcosine oxidase subunit gamma
MSASASTSQDVVLIESCVVTVRRKAPIARLSLRARGDLNALNQVLGFTLPLQIGKCASQGDIKIVCHGPDEWMIQAPEAAAPGIAAACAGIYPSHPHSLVDVSGREVTFALDGPRTVELLSVGMPRDPDSLSVGDAKRINFDGLTVVLWRDGLLEFQMDVWNSFAPHVLGLLQTGCRELAAEPAL